MMREPRCGPVWPRGVRSLHPLSHRFAPPDDATRRDTAAPKRTPAGQTATQAGL
jgi:hypothetical protein